MDTLTWGDLIRLTVGLLQCGLIGWGLRIMSAGNDSRTAQNEALLTSLKQQGDMLASQGDLLASVGAGIQKLLQEKDSKAE